MNNIFNNLTAKKGDRRDSESASPIGHSGLKLRKITKSISRPLFEYKLA